MKFINICKIIHAPMYAFIEPVQNTVQGTNQLKLYAILFACSSTFAVQLISLLFLLSNAITPNYSLKLWYSIPWVL